MKMTNANAKREVFAYLMFLGVFWGFIYLVGELESFLNLYDQAWVTSWTRSFLNYVALILGILTANYIGSISYSGLSLVSLFGVVGLYQVLFFRNFSSQAESISFSPWYRYICGYAFFNSN